MATRPDSRQVVLRSTQGMLGTSANDTLDTIFPKINDEIAKLFEDRNAMLQNGGLITFTGTQIDFTENLEIAINSKVAGGAPTVISLGSTSRAVSANGRMVYAVIDRSLGTATVTADVTSLPAVTSSNQEVFLIAKRVDTSEGIQRLYWRNGTGQNAGQTLRLGASGTGSGSGLGDDLITTQFQASFTDEFAESATMSSSAVDSTKTNATYSAAKSLYQISYDASKTVSTSGTTATMSSAPSFTVVAGDMLISGGVAKRIVTVTTQTSYVLESAFSSNLSSAACSVSQAVHTKDIYNTAFDGSAISSAFSTSFSEILVDYEDTSTVGDDIFDIGIAPVVGFVASNDNSSWSTVQVRPTLPLTQVSTLNLPTSGSALYIRLFANKSSGSGTVNVLKYKAYMQKTPSYSSGGVLNSALAFTNSVGTPINCSVGLSSGKTSITLTWTYPVGINPSTSNGALEVYLNGQKIPRYVDSVLTPDASYTEVSPTVILLDQNYSALNISVEVVLPAVYIDQSSQNSTNISAQAEMVTEGFQGFVKNSSRLNATTATGAPTTGNFYSSIINRASIVDITQDLRASLGVERVMTQQIYQLQDEFGSNGEPVFRAVNDDRGLIRFVGSGWYSEVATYGNGISTQKNGDYIEITFYGTGLNILSANDAASRDYRAATDGGATGSNFYTGVSSAITARNYSSNVIMQAVSGLTLGVHTVKILNNSANGMWITGFEVLNTSSTTSINVNQGTSYVNGKKLTALTSTLSAYNSGFESGTLGTNGGRVLVYQKSNGAIAKALTPTNSSPAYLTSADHTNEEVARVFHPSEFGAGRSDDWSLNVPSNSTRVFTLDNNTTTLTSTSSQVGIYGGKFGQYFYTGQPSFFTFVGTGVDIQLLIGSGETGIYTLSVDGVSLGTLSYTVGTEKIYKVASGLPYGTHTLKIAPSGTPAQIILLKYITYQPKTPKLPENCVELSAYNIMANFAPPPSAGVDTVSKGILKKSCSREHIFSGTWIGPSGSPLLDWNGVGITTTTLDNYAEYVFFGTGFDLRWYSDNTNASTSVQMSLQSISTGGSLQNLTATNFSTASFSTVAPAGVSFNSTTGILNQRVSSGTQPGCSFSCSNLPLGVYKVRMTNKASGQTMLLNGFDVITPIHSPVSNVSYDQQNTLPIGNCSLSDNRKTSAIKEILPFQKTCVQALGLSNTPTVTSSSYVPMPDMSATLKTNGGRVRVSFVASMNNSTGGFGGYNALYVNGMQFGPDHYWQVSTSSGVHSSMICLEITLSAGTHKFDIYWKAGGGTANTQGTSRSLIVEEV